MKPEHLSSIAPRAQALLLSDGIGFQWWFRATIEAVMAVRPDQGSTRESSSILSNAEIADRLACLAQLLSSQKENPYKVKAYQRAAARIRNLPESPNLVFGELAIGRGTTVFLHYEA